MKRMAHAPANLRRFFVTVTTLCALSAQADQWKPAAPLSKSFHNGLILVKVHPPLTEGDSPRAEILQTKSNATTKPCSGNLVNKMRPVEVFASPDGTALVTVDEWGRSGYEHTLVFYRCEGSLALKKAYSLDESLTPAEIKKHSHASISSRNWSRNTELRVEKDAFIVKLQSGRTIRFSLTDGTLKK
jgi:hypothetical protein